MKWSGELFLATKGGVNYELGDRKVYVLTTEDINDASVELEALSKFVESRDVPPEAVESAMESVSNLSLRLEPELNTISQGLEHVVSSNIPWEHANKLRTEKYRLRRELSDLKRRASALVNSLNDEIRALRFHHDETIAEAFEDLNRIFFGKSVVTDSRGRFEFDATDVEILLANATIQTGDSVNSYYWITKPMKEKTLLTGSNSISSYSLQHLLQNLFRVTEIEVAHDASELEDVRERADTSFNEFKRDADDLLKASISNAKLELDLLEAVKKAQQNAAISEARRKQKEAYRKQLIGRHFHSVGMRSGRIEDARVTQVRDDGVAVRHKGGHHLFPWSDVPKEWRKYQ